MYLHVKCLINGDDKHTATKDLVKRKRPGVRHQEFGEASRSVLYKLYKLSLSVSASALGYHFLNNNIFFAPPPSARQGKPSLTRWCRSPGGRATTGVVAVLLPLSQLHYVSPLLLAAPHLGAATPAPQVLALPMLVMLRLPWVVVPCVPWVPQHVGAAAVASYSRAAGLAASFTRGGEGAASSCRISPPHHRRREESWPPLGRPVSGGNTSFGGGGGQISPYRHAWSRAAA